MVHEYGRIECRVCGEQVIVPLPAPLPETVNSGDNNGRSHELTCSKGHTDSYDLAKVESISSKPVSSFKTKRAATGMG